MPRKSLRPHLNQIRAWAREGRTDAWVAHQLEVSVRDIEQFKRQNDLAGDEPGETPSSYPEEIDLRAEADAEAERALAEAPEPSENGDEPDDGPSRTRRPRSRRGGRRRSGARNTEP